MHNTMIGFDSNKPFPRKTRCIADIIRRYPEKIAVGCTSLEALGYVMQILRNGILQKALIYHRQGDSVEKT